MAKAIFLCTCLILHTYVRGAPNTNKNQFVPDNPFLRKNEEKIDVLEPKLDDDQINTQLENVGTENTRKKRMYNYIGFDFPSFPSSIPLYPYPPNLKDNVFNNGPYNAPDPYHEILKRVQEIATTIKQPSFPSPQGPQGLPPIFSPSRFPQFPYFVPVFYIPQATCKCAGQPNNTNPGVDTRFPVMEDTNQNWGLVVNETFVEEGDGSRPISFVPIAPTRPVRPPPPVEHGSSQAGDTSTRRTTTTTTSRPLPPLSSLPPVNNLPALNDFSTTTFMPPTATPVFEPTICDGAVLNCCHQRLELTQNCIVAQGCPELLQYQNPCDSRLVFDVIQKFTAYYRRRLGQSQ